jgi:hypothetical protein
MELTLESGAVIDHATEQDILSLVAGEEFAILAADPDTYMQCAELKVSPYGHVLEYQAGGIDRHYRAVAEPITLDRVIAAFLKYLRRDETWLTDFQWEKVEL